MAGLLLSIESLRIEARGRPLVDGVSLALNRGEVLGLIGESGAGKTTIGLASMGYVRPGCAITGGRIVFDGQDLTTLTSPALRAIRGARIAYVAQSASASFNPARRLGHQVAESMVLHQSTDWPTAHRNAAGLFEELDLPSPGSFGERYPHQVSGGQLQRAMIAMAMACRPELLILDEPTTALDVTTQIEVLAAVRGMLQRHAAAGIYISHDLAVVVQLADRLAILQRGRLVETGPTTDILERPVEDYSRRLVAARTAPELHCVDPLGEEAPPILAVRSLAAGYRTTPNVLSDISFTLRAGESLAVVGTSGSGKSTLARVICGLMPQQSGTVEFHGERLLPEVSARTKEQLRSVQMIYQLPDTALNPRHRMSRILGRAVSFYFGGGRDAVRRRVAELLEMVGLPPECADRRASELSGGQKQRVCIARALAARPDVIICDEVTSALDPLVAEEVLALLQSLQKSSGAAYIFITHDIGVVRRVATHVAVLQSGRLIANGPISRVFAPPFHPHTQVLLESVPQLRTDWLTGILAGRKNGL